MINYFHDNPILPTIDLHIGIPVFNPPLIPVIPVTTKPAVVAPNKPASER